MKEIPFLPLFQKFINNSKSGRCLKADGKRIKPQTIDNYGYVYRNLVEFRTTKSFPLRIVDQRSKDTRLLQAEKTY